MHVTELNDTWIGKWHLFIGTFDVGLLRLTLNFLLIFFQILKSNWSLPFT